MRTDQLKVVYLTETCAFMLIVPDLSDAMFQLMTFVSNLVTPRQNKCLCVQNYTNMLQHCALQVYHSDRTLQSCNRRRIPATLYTRPPFGRNIHTAQNKQR